MLLQSVKKVPRLGRQVRGGKKKNWPEDLGESEGLGKNKFPDPRRRTYSLEKGEPKPEGGGDPRT